MATVTARGDSLTTSLGLPVAGDGSAHAVVRIDDSFSALWSRLPDDSIAARLDRRLARILALLDAQGAPRPLQLDYDCPTGLLARYAAVLARMRRSSLRDRTLWMTSLVAHVRDPAFGPLFRPLVEGHIVQVFDTGESFADAAASRLPQQLEKHRMPYMLGVASFERRLAGGTTAHRAWFALLPRLASSPWYRGVWVFPAGNPWVHLMPTE